VRREDRRQGRGLVDSDGNGSAVARLVIGVAGVMSRHIVGAGVDLVAAVSQRRGDGAQAARAAYRAGAAGMGRAVVGQRAVADRDRRGRRLVDGKAERRGDGAVVVFTAGKLGHHRVRAGVARSRTQSIVAAIVIGKRGSYSLETAVAVD